MPVAPPLYDQFELKTDELGTPIRLEQGGTGRVYRAVDTKSGAQVALKLVDDPALKHPDARLRFFNEVRSVSLLHHPNVVQVLHLCREDAPQLFFVTELAEGESLAARVERDGPLSPHEALRLLRPVAEALAALGKSRLVHHDIKPANIMIAGAGTARPQVKLVGFGLARSLSTTDDYLANLRADKRTISSIYFASPEQGRLREPLDARSDFYSLGATLWYALSGAPPFTGTFVDVQASNLYAEPPWDKLGNVPEPVIALLRRLLAKARDQRPANAHALLAAWDKTAGALPAAPKISEPASVAPAAPAAQKEEAANLAQTIVDPIEEVPLSGSVATPEVDDPSRTVTAPATDDLSRTIATPVADDLSRTVAPPEGDDLSRTIAAPDADDLSRTIVATVAEPPSPTASSNGTSTDSRSGEPIPAEELTERNTDLNATATGLPGTSPPDEKVDLTKTAVRLKLDFPPIVPENQAPPQPENEAPTPAAPSRAPHSIPPVEKETPLPVAPPPPSADENVQFTVYRPRALEVERWATVLAFTHLGARRADAPANEPDPLAEVARQAEVVLGDSLAKYKETQQESSQPLARDGEVILRLELPGAKVVPEEQSFLWEKSVHREDFHVLAPAALAGQTLRGRLTAFRGSIIFAEVNLTFAVHEPGKAATEIAREPVIANAFRKIFVSYAREDSAIVDECEQFAKITGDRYLRDVSDLRAGEVWNDQLKRLIREAEVFQLFWSSNSMRSPQVRQEWEFALSLRRANFVRPTYWEEPLPEWPEGNVPGEELRRLHFQKIRARSKNPGKRPPQNVPARQPPTETLPTVVRPLKPLAPPPAPPASVPATAPLASSTISMPANDRSSSARRPRALLVVASLCAVLVGGLFFGAPLLKRGQKAVPPESASIPSATPEPVSEVTPPVEPPSPPRAIPTATLVTPSTPRASQVTPAPALPDPTAKVLAENVRRRVEQFIRDYLVAKSGDDAEALSKFFAPEVDYYGEHFTHFQLVRDVEQDHVKWPKHTQTLASIGQVAYHPGSASASVDYYRRYEVQNGEAFGHGTMLDTMEIDLRGATPVVLRLNSRVIERQLDTFQGTTPPRDAKRNR